MTSRAGVRMGKWLLGQATLMLILGVTSTVVYVCLHIRYAYALGVLTGLLNFIPVLGAAITIVLVLVVAAVDSWGRVLGSLLAAGGRRGRSLAEFTWRDRHHSQVQSSSPAR